MAWTKAAVGHDFPPIRFNLKRQTLARFGYGVPAPHASLRARSKVVLGERVAPLRVIFPPNRRLERRFGGNVLGLRDRAKCQTHSTSEASWLGS